MRQQPMIDLISLVLKIKLNIKLIGQLSTERPPFQPKFSEMILSFIMTEMLLLIRKKLVILINHKMTATLQRQCSKILMISNKTRTNILCLYNKNLLTLNSNKTHSLGSIPPSLKPFQVYKKRMNNRSAVQMILNILGILLQFISHRKIQRAQLFKYNQQLAFNNLRP